MPVSIVLFAVVFNLFNTYVQGKGVFLFGTNYTVSWLTDVRFLVGVILFIAGYVINKYADFILRTLRKQQDGYSIPAGGLYNYISCPNYFGEIVTWIGWATLTWSLAGVVFVLWTVANLLPRAISHHKWYNETFADYPVQRKAIIPFVI